MDISGHPEERGLMDTSGHPEERGLVKSFSGNKTPSSKRALHCKNMAEESMKRCSRAIGLAWRKRQKKDAKDKVLNSIPTIVLQAKTRTYKQEDLLNIPHFFHPNWNDCHEEYFGRPKQKSDDSDDDSFEENQFYGHTAPGNPEKIINMENILGKLQVVDTLDGAKLLETRSNLPIIILCPRKLIDDQDVKANSDVLHLDTILSKYSKLIKGRTGETISKGRGKKNRYL
jgi:hypothetical protein